MKRIITPELFNLNSKIDFYNCGQHGNCFHAAFVVFLQLFVGNFDQPDFREVLLCHGTVKLLGGSDRIVHGWVEAQFDGCSDAVCFDASAVGQKMSILSKRQYYRMTDTSESLVHTYDFGELMAITELSKHTGIWEPPLEPVIDNLDETELIAAEHWPHIRSQRGTLSGMQALESMMELRERLRQQEMANHG